MRLAMTLCLVSAIVVLAGCCGAGGCGVAKAPSMNTPAAYGSASGTTASRVVYQRTPTAVVREVARPAAPSFERRIRTFTPPSAPVIPAARRAAPVRSASVVARAPAPCPTPVVECPPVQDDCCPGGNCGIPSVDDCGLPSLGDLLNPCK
ncbi:MAG: hypothetical protein QNJ90_11970 [Planctomycetota bacterium]|nr:hypothetical protein [Planctomycetota bacterium]